MNPLPAPPASHVPSHVLLTDDALEMILVCILSSADAGTHVHRGGYEVQRRVIDIQPLFTARVGFRSA